MLVGIVGKTNVGKTTFFSAATLAEAEIGDRPFVTIEPNEAVGHARVKSLCTEFGVKCEPRFGWCNGRFRYVPLKLMDVAGLVPGAHKGRGLGNKFLDDLRRASVHILVVDASGGTDDEGKPSTPGTHDPIRDVNIVKEEFAHWLKGILKRNMSRIKRRASVARESPEAAIGEVLSGLGIGKEDVQQVCKRCELDASKIWSWGEEALLSFSALLRETTKPMMIAANKIDVHEAEDNVRSLKEELGDVVIPTSAEAELILRRAAAAGVVEYSPGDPDFEIIDESGLTKNQLKALRMIEESVLDRYGSTGVQEVVDKSVFDATGMKALFPVESETKLSDGYGRVLPDVFLLEKGADVRELAKTVHTDIGEDAVAGIDARTKKRIGLEQKPKHRDVIRILTRR